MFSKNGGDQGILCCKKVKWRGISVRALRELIPWWKLRWQAFVLSFGTTMQQQIRNWNRANLYGGGGLVFRSVYQLSLIFSLFIHMIQWSLNQPYHSEVTPISRRARHWRSFLFFFFFQTTTSILLAKKHLRAGCARGRRTDCLGHTSYVSTYLLRNSQIHNSPASSRFL